MLCDFKEDKVVSLLIGDVSVEFANVRECVVHMLWRSVLNVTDNVKELLYLGLHSRTTRFYYGFVKKN